MMPYESSNGWRIGFSKTALTYCSWPYGQEDLDAARLYYVTKKAWDQATMHCSERLVGWTSTPTCPRS